jgi:MoaA/NifB/PqqE/SkfB family radical SAM enzyme
VFDKKILCLGTNDTITDQMVTELAKLNETTNFGLIITSDFNPMSVGYYHTSIIDIPLGGIIELAKCFDTIIMLDQPRDSWSHWKLLLSTYKLMVELEKQGNSTVYKDNINIQKYKQFDEKLQTNKSFCIYPWIEIISDSGYLTTCARSAKKVTTIQELGNWKTNSEYQKIRKAMLAGELLPEHCEYCYNYERKGIESYREFETREWIAKLNINSFEDLDNIEHPYYYEIRLNNKCNLSCRSCKPEHSNSIEKEYKKFNIIYPYEQGFTYSSIDLIDINTLTPKTRVYLTGGEPTVMTEVYEFMEKCIDAGKLDFDFTLGTNAAKISKRFLKLSQNFTNMNFSVSLDGYGKINDYWRWGSDFDTVIKNSKILEAQGHTISINCVPGIYNVTNLHLLFEFLDIEFPHCGIYLQINHSPMQSAYNHPNADLVVESMERCKQTKTYYKDGKSCRSSIDSLLAYYSQNPKVDTDNLRLFFEYNDQLDLARNVKLIDYIPELEECRKYL